MRKRAGCIYITDDTGANPWDRLPSYWEEEVAAVAAENQRAIRQPGQEPKRENSGDEARCE